MSALPRRRPRPRHAGHAGQAGLAAPLPHPSSESARLRRLIEAQSVINSDLSLSDVLTRIVHTACELAGARHGALGVLGRDERVEYLVQAGGPGLVVVDPRVPAARQDDTISFLSVPIVVRGETVGEIYLGDAVRGVFTPDDEELVSALAATAGTAIVNARLYDESQRSHTWARASHEITRALLAEADVDMLLEVVSHALAAAEADMGMLALPDRHGVLRTTVSVGLGAERFEDWTFTPQDSPISAIMATGRFARRESLAGLTRTGFANPDNYGPIMVAPLVDAKGHRGSVLLVRTADRTPFSASDLDQLSTFADQVALALDMDDARSAAESLRELEVRHAIAQDLHDNVIQRLFATGMGLHSIDTSRLPGTVGERLDRYVGEFDETIDQIRERVFGLRGEAGDPDHGKGRFRHVEPPALGDSDAARPRRPAPWPCPRQ